MHSWIWTFTKICVQSSGMLVLIEISSGVLVRRVIPPNTCCFYGDLRTLPNKKCPNTTLSDCTPILEVHGVHYQFYWNCRYTTCVRSQLQDSSHCFCIQKTLKKKLQKNVRGKNKIPQSHEQSKKKCYFTCHVTF